MEQMQFQPTETTATDIVAEHYDTYKEVQQDILDTETRKTRNAILIVAAILFSSDLLALLMANAVTGTNLLYILIVPVLFAAIGFFALKQPLIAIITAIVLYAGLWASTVYAYGGAQILSGLVVKAATVTLLLMGLNNAREAEKARKNLKSV